MGQLSLFQIAEEFEAIYAELEDNGGELSEELEEKLAITEQNFKEKITGYCNLIRRTKLDVDSAKKEKDRVTQFAKVKANTLDRLQERVKEALLLYGQTGPSGNKRIDLPNGSAYIRGAKSVEEDMEVIQFIRDKIEYFMRENQDIKTDIRLEELYTYISNICEDKFGHPLCLEDFDTLSYGFNFELSFYDIIRSSCRPLWEAYFNFETGTGDKTIFSAVLHKTMAKRVLEKQNLNIADLKENKSLIVK